MSVLGPERLCTRVVLVRGLGVSLELINCPNIEDCPWAFEYSSLHALDHTLVLRISTDFSGFLRIALRPGYYLLINY